MFHTYERAYKTIEDMTMNLYIWTNERFMYKSKTPTMKAMNEENNND